MANYVARSQCDSLKQVNELVFEITQDADGGFSAECLSESIFTQGDTWEELDTAPTGDTQ
jgi:hypothetical protein